MAGSCLSIVVLIVGGASQLETLQAPYGETAVRPSALSTFDDECASEQGHGADGSACGLSVLQRRGRKAGGADIREPNKERRVERRFAVWLSDVHVDPAYGVSGQYGNDSAYCVFGCHKSGCPTRVSAAFAASNHFGVMGCDPPMLLWESAVAAAAQVGRGAELVLFTGDFVRHASDKMPDPAASVTGTVGGSAHALARAFDWLAPERFVVGTPGNADSPNNYELDITPANESNPWLSSLAAGLKEAEVMPPDRALDYARGGFFETTLGGVRILSINTLAYAARHVPAEPAPEDPFGQLAWLRGRLDRAALEQQRVWIVGHIPPGIETFGYTSVWKPQYVKAYLDIVQHPERGRWVAAQLFGHTHKDEFRLLPGAPEGAGPVLLAGSVSPVYLNNPSFRLVEYDASTGDLLNVKVFYAAWPEVGAALEWKFGYDLVGSYAPLARAATGAGGLSNAAFRQLAGSLRQSWADAGPEFRSYAEWYAVRCPSDLFCALQGPAVQVRRELSVATKARFVGKYLCGVVVATQEDFEECVRPYVVAAGSPPKPGDFRSSVAYYQAARLTHWMSITETTEQAHLQDTCLHMVRQVDR